MTPALFHMLGTGFLITAGILSLISIVRSFRESWEEFLDALGEQDR